MADDSEFAQFVTQAVAEIAPAPAAAPPAEAKAADPPKVEQPAAKEPEPAKPVEAKEEPKPEPKPEPAWKVKAAEEKAKREARNAAKGNEAQLQAKLAAVEAELAKWKAIEAKKATDPLGAAEELGLSYDRLTKEYIKGLDKDGAPQAPPEVAELRQKIQHVESLLKQQQQTIEQRAQAEAMQSFKAEVTQVLTTQGDDFEHVKAHPQGVDLVREIVRAHFRDTATFDKDGTLIAPGEVMSTEEACGRAEEWIQNFLGNFKGTKSFAAKVEAKAEEKPAPKKPEAPTLSQDLRTGGTKSEPHGDEVEQLLLLKKTLEAQLNASAGN